jgi:hypothetical protein
MARGCGHLVAPVPGIPVKLSDTPGGVERLVPRLGEHTDVWLAERGDGGGGQRQLRDAGAGASRTNH